MASGEPVRLDDGRRIIVRPVEPTDLPELRRALREADPETIRQRFLGGRPPKTTQELRHLVEVNHAHREAIVALTEQGQGVGIARYEMLSDARTAEVAVAVDPEWRGVGVATVLLTRLVRRALRNGVTSLQAAYYAANTDVDDLLSRAGAVTSRQLAGGIIEETVTLDPAAFVGDADDADESQRPVAVHRQNVEHLTLTLLGVGAMASPRFRPAGLLVEWRTNFLVIDGGDPLGVPPRIEAWLVCDGQAELSPQIRRLAAARGIKPSVEEVDMDGLSVCPMPVLHTNHPTYGYLLTGPGFRVGWAPEFWRYPEWAHDLDLLFADGAAWTRPIRFRGGVGGHACVAEVAEAARANGVRRLVFAHLGRPTLAALDAGRTAAFGEFGVDGQVFVL